MSAEHLEQDIPVPFDLSGDDLTLNERIEVELVCGGLPFPQLRDEASASFHRAVLWMLGRRLNPSLSLFDAGEMKVSYEGGADG